MPNWSAIAYLPNLSVGTPIEGEYVALVSTKDDRLRALCAQNPKIADFLSRFTDAFGVAQEPAVLIGDPDALASKPDAILSFRDLIALSVIPYSRSLNTVRGGQERIVYADSFSIYPWTFSVDYQHLITATPALHGLHVVDQFHGQSSPGLSPTEISDFDYPLFDSLLARWKRYYFGTRPRWKDRALFRSLNMAFQAALMPSAVATSLLDLGRSISLWVAAFEILTHPKVGKANLDTVYPLFKRLAYCDKNIAANRYVAYTPGINSRKQKTKKVVGGSSEKRSPLPCWIYGKLYAARNDFLHGNPVSITTIDPKRTGTGLFWLAPSLYRLALASALDLRIRKKLPYWLSHEYDNSPKLKAARKAYERQEMCERALLSILKRNSRRRA